MSPISSMEILDTSLYYTDCFLLSCGRFDLQYLSHIPAMYKKSIPPDGIGLNGTILVLLPAWICSRRKSRKQFLKDGSRVCGKYVIKLFQEHNNLDQNK